MGEYFIELKEVTKQYTIGSTVINAVDGLSFGIKEGEFTVILGPSGAGKSTILNLLGGMDSITSGEIIVDNNVISVYNDKQLTKYRRDAVGFVFQFYNLMPNLTALENIELAVEICNNSRNPKEVLNMVGLGDRANNFPSQLSGGEQQRVSIARAIAKNPKLLLCDEPTGALDYNTGKLILKLIHDLCRIDKKSVIVVTHNSALQEMADKVINVKNGKIESVQLIENPKLIDYIEW